MELPFKDTNVLLQSIKDTNNLLFQETLKVDNLKNTWIAQLITLSATLIGGFSILKGGVNCFSFVGFIILFITIVYGLWAMISNLNNKSKALDKTFEKQNNYAINLFLLLYFEQKNELTDEEKTVQEKATSGVISFFNEMGLIDNNGNFSQLKIPKEKIPYGNYILIIGFCLGSFLIILSDFLMKIFC